MEWYVIYLEGKSQWSSIYLFICIYSFTERLIEFYISTFMALYMYIEQIYASVNIYIHRYTF